MDETGQFSVFWIERLEALDQVYNEIQVKTPQFLISLSMI
jgi:hypothetical protein